MAGRQMPVGQLGIGPAGAATISALLPMFAPVLQAATGTTALTATGAFASQQALLEQARRETELRQSRTRAFAIVGGVLVAGLLLGGILWAGRR